MKALLLIITTFLCLSCYSQRPTFLVFRVKPEVPYDSMQKVKYYQAWDFTEINRAKFTSSVENHLQMYIAGYMDAIEDQRDTTGFNGDRLLQRLKLNERAIENWVQFLRWYDKEIKKKHNE